jgi:CBS domain-containing protein
MQISVRDLMSTRPVTVSASTSLEEATQIVLERALDALCVCDDDGRLLGTVSDYELLKSRLLNSDMDQPIGPIVSCSVITLAPDMLLEEVAGFFRNSCHQRLAVLESGRLVGQLHRRDVLRALVIARQIEADRQTVRIEEAERNVPSAPTIRKVPILRIVSASSDD